MNHLQRMAAAALVGALALHARRIGARVPAEDEPAPAFAR